MTQILFDCNYLLYKNVFTLYKMNRLYSDLWVALDNNINKYISMNKWDNVYIISDSNKKSWRQQELSQYKGHRNRLEDIDWDWVFEQYNLWKTEISKKYNILQYDAIEGDDWIASLVLKGNKLNYSNVIITSDEDMPQLLNYKLNGKDSYINIQIIDHTGNEKVYLPIGWELYLKEINENQNDDIFNLDNSNEWRTFINKIINQWQYVEINPYQRLFVKIIQGDKSDNIKSIYEKLTTTGKVQGIGKAGAEKIWQFYKDNYKDYFNTKEKTFIDDLVNCIESVYKIELSITKKEQVKNNIIQNIKLIELHYRHFPDWVVEKIVDKLSKCLI